MHAYVNICQHMHASTHAMHPRIQAPFVSKRILMHQGVAWEVRKIGQPEALDVESMLRYAKVC